MKNEPTKNTFASIGTVTTNIPRSIRTLRKKKKHAHKIDDTNNENNQGNKMKSGAFSKEHRSYFGCKDDKSDNRARVNHFPFPLYEMVCHVTREDPEVLEWLEDGGAFIVHDEDKKLGKYLATFFRHSKYTSFQRQLNMYGFKKHTMGIYKGAFHHPDFHRDNGTYDVLASIKRRPPPSDANRILSNVNIDSSTNNKSKATKRKKTNAEEDHDVISSKKKKPLIEKETICYYNSIENDVEEETRRHQCDTPPLIQSEDDIAVDMKKYQNTAAEHVPSSATEWFFPTTPARAIPVTPTYTPVSTIPWSPLHKKKKLYSHTASERQHKHGADNNNFKIIFDETALFNADDDVDAIASNLFGFDESEQDFNCATNHAPRCKSHDTSCEHSVILDNWEQSNLDMKHQQYQFDSLLVCDETLSQLSFSDLSLPPMMNGDNNDLWI